MEALVDRKTNASDVIPVLNKFDQTLLNPSYAYLIKLALVLSLSSAHFGATLSASGQVGPALEQQIPGWLDNDNSSLYNTAVNSMSIAGVGLGSIIGPNFVNGGRKRCVQVFNVVGIISCILCIVPNIYVLCAGRLLYGFVSGVMVVASPMILSETVPGPVMDKGFGIATNLAINFFVMVSFLLGFLMPEDTDIQGLKDTQIWKFIYMGPSIACILSILLLIFWHTEDSLHFHIMRNDKDNAMVMIAKIYPDYDMEVHENVYNDIHTTLNKQEANVSVKDCLFDKNYSSATWLCLFTAVANTATGINIINIYALKMFK